VYEFKDQKIKEYLGDIDFYLDQRNVENLREIEKRDVVKEQPKETNKQTYEDQKKFKSLNNRLSNIEAKISQHEKDIKSMDVSLASDYDKTAADPKFFDRYKGKKSKLANLMTEWETIHEDLEQIS
jgi:ATP-binding cassette subfamily F protein 3